MMYPWEHNCVRCGRYFTARADAKVCGNACRQAMHRRRRKALVSNDAR